MGEHAPYDPNSDIWKVKRPAVAVDVVLLTIQGDDLRVGLIRREDEPYFGSYALPGRFVRYEEPIEETVKKALQNKGNIDSEGIYLEQLYTFGQNLMRDTRIRTISVVYYALVPAQRTQGTRLEWHSVYALPELAFDHKDIITFSLERIRAQLFHKNLIFTLLPAEFTLTELQRAFEVILNESLDKRNFRKKIAELSTLKDTGHTKMHGAHRPAKLYKYVGKK